MSLRMDLFDGDGELVAQVALLDVDPDPSDPEEGAFTTLDIDSFDEMSPDDWRQFLEGLIVEDEKGNILTPDHGDKYLERLALEFRSPYLNAGLEEITVE